jgi:4-diphosphocytidyl-2-C-methyl-D-erythritol kinase
VTPKVYRSFAKINAFLKITGTRENYHEITSRFVLFKELHDDMWFEKGNGETFEIIGNFECDRKDNTIFKAFLALTDFIPSKKILEFGKQNKIAVQKNIPKFAGLGGGSSNAATFLHMINDTMELGISVEDLANIGSKVGADVPFFVYKYDSANVSGIGEIVEPMLDDDIPAINLITPDFECSTVEVYKTFRKYFMGEIDIELARHLPNLTTRDILEGYRPIELNDLFKAVLKKYPEFYEYNDSRWFLSGSGSSIFKLQ